jgi:hypothetical protein
VLRLILVLAAAAIVGGCGAWSDDADPAEPSTRLEISVWRAGTDGPVRTATVECPAQNDVCDRLAELDDPFAPLPGGAVCTQIYGGPQVAEVRGTFEGDPVNARFNRTNGCEIERWDRVAFLFPTR